MSTRADLIITSARLWDGSPLDAEAIAIGAGMVQARGSNRDIMQLRSGETRLIDVEGRRVIPGLIDSHIHLVRAGRTWAAEVRWEGVTTLERGLADIADHVEHLPTGSWTGVIGGWHPGQFEERRPPTRAELDRAAPEHPVFVQRNYVEAFLNSRALDAMGWTDAHPDGRVVDPASLAVLRAAITNDEAAMVDSTREMLRELNRLGLTGAIDAAGFGMNAESYVPFFALFDGAERGFRTRLLVGAATPGEERADFGRWVETVAPGSGDDFVRYLGAGELVTYAAHDMEGLSPRDVSPATAEIAAISQDLADRGWPVHVHGILDSSVRVILDAWETLEPRGLPAELRYAICHADQVGEENLRRIADLGVGITLQGGMAFRGLDSAATWAVAQLEQAPRPRTMLDLGIPVGAGSDGTVAASYNPWTCISWLVTGKTVDGSAPRDDKQLVDVSEALRLYTGGSAWFSFEADTRGNLQPGSHADLAVLSTDPLTSSPDSLPSVESVMTIVGGEIIHSNIDTRG